MMLQNIWLTSVAFKLRHIGYMLFQYRRISFPATDCTKTARQLSVTSCDFCWSLSLPL